MLLAILPLIILDGIGLVSRGSGGVPSNLAHDQLNAVMGFLDIPPVFMVFAGGAIIVVVLLTWHLFKNEPWGVRPVVLAGIPSEGVLWAIPLLLIAPLFTISVLSSTTSPDGVASLPVVDRVLVSISAGLYEELLFRMVGIALLHALFVDLFRMKNLKGTLLAIIGSACAFAWYHDPSLDTPAEAAFYLLAGLELGILFVARGFAIAVWTHVIYNTVIFTTMSSGS